MQKNMSPGIAKVERDPRLFMWFLTLVVASMYTVTLLNVPALRQWDRLIPFTVLVLIHLTLHWMLETISKSSTGAMWYTIIQGVLALVIAWMAGEIGLITALFMGLLGEAVGLFGITRRGLLAGVYYLVLLIVSLVLQTGWESSGLFILTLVPMSIFVVIYVTLYMRQTEAREQAQLLAAELETANRQLAEYAAQVEDLTIANERQRMARELHDTLSQGLAGIILQLEAVEAHLTNHRLEKAQNIIASAKIEARATLTGARAAIDDLRKSSPEDLSSALHLETSRFTAATGIPCDVHAEPTGPLTEPVKETVVRAVAEGLANVARYAQARQVAVNVWVENKTLQVTIRDDGQGFDANEIPAGHYGLIGIGERVRMVNGSFKIDSQAGVGTTLQLEIPL